MYKCDYADEIKNGMCAHKSCRCNGIVEKEEFFIDGYKFETIEIKDICKESSPFGNYYLRLTDADIQTIKNGGVLGVLDEEYNIFIAYKGEAE